MSLFLFLTVVQAIIAAALVGIVLMQRSEGGGLGIGGGGSPGGLMSARGAADFLTRMTKWLAVVFVVLAIAMAAVAVGTTKSKVIDDSLDRTVTPAGQPPVTGPATTDGAAGDQAPASNDPLRDVAQ
ncbi:preprotein translocase subunit SecG [Croceibacterium aestuarii]|uniref:preprotein translocase subunit SecG n=1 Tax=Croceibacterium aestuarii TaxID=3064139 RepID=UPI00272E576A|nr:preprotein translocase subunit SecG [Croceibacterium sp. D39]